ncbi:MAG: L-threonylcarbamoyladenylate synthase [Pseudomonadota bacterium]
MGSVQGLSSMGAELAAEIERAGEIIRAGGLVAAPTETVYGLAADAFNDHALAAIYAAKGRPQFNPLIVHFPSLSAAAAEVEMSPLAAEFAAAFWPGPLTLVLRRKPTSRISKLASAGLDTLAVRVPAHPVFQALLSAAGTPLAAPSANPSGAVSPTSAAHVRAGLADRVALILDGGPSSVGVESTIVKVDDDKAVLLRPGGAPRAALEAVAGALVSPQAIDRSAPKIEAPGMLESHYAPRARVRLDADAPHVDEAYLAFGPAPAEARFYLNLSAKGDLTEAAANLFAHLHTLDKMCAENGLTGLAVAPVPSDGLGEAIRDRLARAAAPRTG